MTDVFALTDAVVHLLGVGPIGRACNEPAFWDHPGRPELNRGQVLSVFTYRTTWDYQERHPDGDELAVVLEGDIDLVLDIGTSATPVPLASGSACVIPAGAWHRVAVREPSTLMFITPVPARTEHRLIGSADTQATGQPVVPPPASPRGTSRDRSETSNKEQQ